MEIDSLFTPEVIANIPNTVLVLIFVYLVIVRDLDKRLNGLSSYIKRFLAIQSRQAKGREALVRSIETLCKNLSNHD